MISINLKRVAEIIRLIKNRRKKNIAICFIDNEKTETDRFKNFFNNQDHLGGKKFLVGVGKTIDLAKTDLMNEHHINEPDLYLLDLYFEKVDRTLDEGDENKLAEAKIKFQTAQNEFEEIIDRLGQTSDGGFDLSIELSGQGKRNYAFFTRKATVDEVIKAYEPPHSALTVIKKPDPKNIQKLNRAELEKRYDSALTAKLIPISKQIERAATRASWWYKHGYVIKREGISFLMGLFIGLILYYILPQ
ncbi:MAG: hypothetical protein Q8O06_11530 [Acetobacterium sp.]|nr:hypothetical protein [Acetobacterium sp.]